MSSTLGRASFCSRCWTQPGCLALHPCRCGHGIGFLFSRKVLLSGADNPSAERKCPTLNFMTGKSTSVPSQMNYSAVLLAGRKCWGLWFFSEQLLGQMGICLHVTALKEAPPTWKKSPLPLQGYTHTHTEHGTLHSTSASRRAFQRLE